MASSIGNVLRRIQPGASIPTLPPALAAAAPHSIAGADALLAIGFALSLSVTLVYCFAAAFLILGASLSPLPSWLLMAAGIGTAIAAGTSVAPGRRRAVVAISLLVLMMAPIMAGSLYDTTIDGQHYHFQAIWALAQGWNPYHEPFRLPADLAPMQPALWPQHYPKASWIVAAVQLSAGLGLEAAKDPGIILLTASFAAATGLLLRLGLKPMLAGAIGLVAAANPIALAQLFTFMNDGLLATCFLLFLVHACLWVGYRDRLALIALAPLMAFALNLKFSAVPMLVVLSAGATLAALLVGGRAFMARTGAALAGFGLAGVALFGSAPYVGNIVAHSHPFYPLLGIGAVDIMHVNMPPVIDGMSGTRSFLYSLFAHTHSGFGTTPELKLPFTVTLAEVRAAGGPDTRIAGFGPLFSGALVLAAALAAACAFARPRTAAALTTLGVAGALLAVAFLFPESWWARYVPKLWLVPVIVAVGGALCTAGRTRALLFALIAVLAANAALVLGSSLALAWKRHAEATAQVHRLVADGRPRRVFFGLANARLVHFREAGLKVAPAGAPLGPDCREFEPIVSYGPDREGGEICLAR